GDPFHQGFGIRSDEGISKDALEGPVNTTQVHVERRAAQRFEFHLPVSIRVAGRDAEAHGFTRDLSARGAFFYTESALTEGDSVELTVTMPSEITLAENMR